MKKGRNRVKELYDVEAEKFKKRSETYKESIKGEEDENIVSYMESAVQNLCDAYDNLSDTVYDDE